MLQVSSGAKLFSCLIFTGFFFLFFFSVCLCSNTKINSGNLSFYISAWSGLVDDCGKQIAPCCHGSAFLLCRRVASCCQDLSPPVSGLLSQHGERLLTRIPEHMYDLLKRKVIKRLKCARLSWKEDYTFYYYLFIFPFFTYCRVALLLFSAVPRCRPGEETSWWWWARLCSVCIVTSSGFLHVSSICSRMRLVRFPLLLWSSYLPARERNWLQL